MEENLALEAFQKEAFNNVLGTYIFEVEASGVKGETSNKLEGTKEGIKLHFLRYGVFNPSPPTIQDNKYVRAPDLEVEEFTYRGHPDKTIDFDQEPVEIKSKSRDNPIPSNFATELTHGEYERTMLRTGYLYILHDEEPHHWIEYEIDSFGNLFPILWENNKKEGRYTDIRDNVTSKKKGSYTVKKDAVVWVAYSRVQWSMHQIEQIQNAPAENERMQKVVCTGYEKLVDRNRKKIHHDYPYNEFMAAFDYTTYSDAVCFEEKLKTLSAIENAPDPNNENTWLEDMFITLQDPLGCAYDLVNIILYKIEYLNAVVEALAMPVHCMDLYKKKLGLEQYGEVKTERLSEAEGEATKEAEEMGYIFSTALTTYKFVYDNPELRDNYDRSKDDWYIEGAISYEKLDAILAIDQRSHARNVINGFRNDLGNLIQSDYYRNAISICSDEEPNPLAVIEGKNIISDHLVALAHYPAMIDRELLLESEYKPLEDEWVQQIIKTNSAESIFSHVDELLFKKIEITNLEAQDTPDWKYTLKFNKKLFSHIGKMGKAYVSFGQSIKMDLLKKQFHFAEREGQNYLVIDQKIIHKENAKLVKEIHKSLASKNDAHKLTELKRQGKVSVKYFLAMDKKYKELGDLGRKYNKSNEKIGLTIKNGKQLPYAKKVDGILKSPQFKSATLIFEILALITHIDEMQKKEKVDVWDKIKYFGTYAKIGSASLNLAESISKEIAKNKLKNFITAHPKASPARLKQATNAINGGVFGAKVSKNVGGKVVTKVSTAGVMIKGFGYVASSYTLYSAIKDANKAFTKKDNDAAVAYSGAAVLSAVSLAATFGLLPLTGVPGLIVAGLGWAMYGLAYYLTDSELDAFFKFFPYGTETPNYTDRFDSQYYNAKKMYENKDALIAPYKSNYLPASFNESYKSVYVRLINLIIGSNIKIKQAEPSYLSPKGTKLYVGSPRNNQHANWFEKNDNYWTNLAIDISFGSFFNSEEALEYEVYLIQHKDPLVGNKSYKLPKNSFDGFTTAATEVADVIEFKEQSFRAMNMEASFKKFHIWLRVPKYIQLAVNANATSYFERDTLSKHFINKHSHIAVLSRYTSMQIELPITPNHKQGYLFNTMPLRKTQEKEKEFLNFSNLRSGNASIITNKALFFQTYPLQN